MGNTTLKIIAKELNLSYTTVSRALRDDEKIKLSTRVLIKQKAKELKYSPNAIAKELVTKKTNSFGLIVPDISEPFMSELAKELSIQASNNGLTLYLCSTNWNHEVFKNYFSTLLSKQVDGIFILPTFSDSEFINSESYRNVKIILVGSGIKNKNVKVFKSDNIQGINLAFEELVKKGKKKIAYLGGNTDLLANEERFLAYKNCLEQYDLEFCNSRVVNDSTTVKFLNGYDTMEKLLSQTHNFDGVICFNDIVALGAFRKLNELGIKIPEDVAITGFDDINFSKFLGIELTTLRQPIEQMAKDCIKYFKEPSNDINAVSLYTPKLIVRKTT